MIDPVLEAAFVVFERDGVGRGTMTDVAEQAGIGRATLYRRFPGKEHVVTALVLHEARELFALLDAELGLEDDPASLFERGLLTALHHLRGHALLRRVLRDEPEVEFMAPYVERAVKTERITPVDPRAAAEWAARVLLSLLLTPSVVVDLDDPQQLKGFVRWIIRGIPRQGETS
jgi:AcrR family transcriptional regulator